MNPITFEYMERFYDELEPLEFYRKLFGVGVLADRDDYGTDEYGSFALHGTMVYPNQGKHGRKEKVWDDLAEIERAQGAEFAIMAPVAYLGWHRVNRNARYLFALAVDLDYIVDSGMNALFQYIGAGRIPRPSFVVCSGNGLHLYYQYVEPIPCYEAAQRRLREYKNALTRLIWNSYITSIGRIRRLKAYSSVCGFLEAKRRTAEWFGYSKRVIRLPWSIWMGFYRGDLKRAGLAIWRHGRQKPRFRLQK